MRRTLCRSIPLLSSSMMGLCRRSSSASDAGVKPLSKRAQFRRLQPDMRLVDKLDGLDLGFCARKSRRVSVAIKRRALTGRGA